MFLWIKNLKSSQMRASSTDGRIDSESMARCGTTFPPLGYQPTPIYTLLANALDLTAPASDALLRNRKTAWIQLAGHAGCFAPAGPHTIWKKQNRGDHAETRSYRALVDDSMRSLIPRFYREVCYNNDTFIEIEDLLQHFSDPNVMDIKMGSRTFLESEVTNQKLRPDLYKKMVTVDPTEPTEEEHENGAITKLRYMQFRERGSSSATLGFRVDAIRFSGEEPCKDLKKVRTKSEVATTLMRFFMGRSIVFEKVLMQLQTIRRRFEESHYFRNHEVIGSSLLILYDKDNKAGIWIIDLAKTHLVMDRLLTHRAEWMLGNHEDGFLTGIDNLIQIMSDLCQRGSIPLAHQVGGAEPLLIPASST